MKTKNNKNIFCSVSAGYSSVMMSIKIKEWFPDHNIIFAMANTSKERAESLDFMDKCDKHYKLDLKWIEAQFNKRGTGVNFNVVKYEKLKRIGEIFEQGIKKLGIPSQVNKWCNRDMKMEPLRKYADSVFGRNNYSIAVGMRADEMDRIRKDYKDNNVFYPLIDRGITKKDRNKFWKKQPIQITIPDFKGNCDLCFKKSNRKLVTIIDEEPDTALWWDEMIKKYGHETYANKPSYNDLMQENNGMSFYRGYNTIEDLVDFAKKPFKKSTDEYVYENDLFDSEDSCGSGCSAF